MAKNFKLKAENSEAKSLKGGWGEKKRKNGKHDFACNLWEAARILF